MADIETISEGNNNTIPEVIKIQDETIKSDLTNHTNVVLSNLESIDIDETPCVQLISDVKELSSNSNVIEISSEPQQQQQPIQKESLNPIEVKKEEYCRLLCYSLFDRGDAQKAIEEHEELMEMIKYESYEERYLKKDVSVEETLSAFPDVSQLDLPNYKGILKKPQHELVDKKSFQEEAKDLEPIFQWAERDGGDVSSVLRETTMGTLSVIRDAKNQRPIKLEELERISESSLSYKDLSVSKYPWMHEVLEDEAKRITFEEDITITGQNIASYIGQFKEMNEQCRADYLLSEKTLTKLREIESVAKKYTTRDAELLSTAFRLQKEMEEKFRKMKEDNLKIQEVLKHKVRQHKDELNELMINLFEKNACLLMSNNELGIAEAEGAKLQDLSKLTQEEMEKRLDIKQKHLDKHTDDLEIAQSCIAAYQEAIIENGQNIMERNKQIAEQVFTRKEKEGIEDFGYFRTMMGELYSNNTNCQLHNILLGDDEMENLQQKKDELHPLPLSKFPESHKAQLKDIQDRIDLNKVIVEECKRIEEYWDDYVRRNVMELTKTWTDDATAANLFSPMMDGIQDDKAIVNIKRAIQHTTKINRNFKELARCVMEGNNNAVMLSRKHCYYLSPNSKDIIQEAIQISIDRPNALVQRFLSDLRDQIKIFQDTNEEYKSREDFKDRYEKSCRNTPWDVMIKQNEELVKQLEQLPGFLLN